MMISIEKFITETNAAKTSDQVFAVFENALSHLGYDRICYSLITDHRSMNLHAGHGVLRNYPDDWMSYYMERGYDKVDPVPKHCFATPRPFTWEKVSHSLNLSDAEQRVMNEAKEAKLLSGMAVPLYGVNGELAGVGLASSAGKTDTDCGTMAMVQMLASQFHLVYLEKEASSPKGRSIQLTPREREILHWAAEGKSDGTIAEILGISYPTVRFHLNNIYKKLDASERVFAVVKAIRYGLILPSYVHVVSSRE